MCVMRAPKPQRSGMSNRRTGRIPNFYNFLILFFGLGFLTLYRFRKTGGGDKLQPQGSSVCFASFTDHAGDLCVEEAGNDGKRL